MLGPNDAVDEIDIAFGKCNFVHNYNLPFHVVRLFVHGTPAILYFSMEEQRSI